MLLIYVIYSIKLNLIQHFIYLISTPKALLHLVLAIQDQLIFVTTEIKFRLPIREDFMKSK